MARTDNLNNFLTDVSTAIKNKKGDSTPIKASEFDTEITNLPSGGGDTVKYFTEELQPWKLVNSLNVPGWAASILEIPTFKFSGSNLRNAFSNYPLNSIDVSNFDTSNVITMDSMFRSAAGVTTIIGLNTFDTSKVTRMSDMFAYCNSISTLDVSSFDTSNVTSMVGMFRYCSQLKVLDVSNFNTSNVLDVSYMFDSVPLITELDISNFDMSKIKNTSNFITASKLENFKMGTNLGKGFTQKSNNYYAYTLNFSGTGNLTHDSLMDIINKLYDLNLTYDVANGGTLYRQKLTLGATNLAKLTEEEIAIATNKGWNVS